MRRTWERIKSLGIKDCDSIVLMVQYAMMHAPRDVEIRAWFLKKQEDAQKLASQGLADAVDEVYEDMQVMRFIVEGWDDPLREKFEALDLDALMAEMWVLRKRTYEVEE